MQAADVGFKLGDRGAADAEDLKEFIPEGLFFGALAFDARPFAGKLDRVVSDFIPTDRHGSEYAPIHYQRQCLWLGLKTGTLKE